MITSNQQKNSGQLNSPTSAGAHERVSVVTHQDIHSPIHYRKACISLWRTGEGENGQPRVAISSQRLSYFTVRMTTRLCYPVILLAFQEEGGGYPGFSFLLLSLS
jgi:hypothetical protein